MYHLLAFLLPSYILFSIINGQDQSTSPSIFPTLSSQSTSPSTLAAPPLVSGSSQYQLLGCYNELPTNLSGRAVGLLGTYYSPIFSPPDTVTVPLCLSSCSIALAPGGAGRYIYVAIENTRECYCGLTLSNASTPQDPAYCSSPCAGDPTTSCGGYNYLALYELQSAIKNNTASTTSSSPSATGSPSSNGTSHNTSGKWVGVGLGIALFIIIIALLVWRSRTRFGPRHQNSTHDRPDIPYMTRVRASIPSISYPKALRHKPSYGMKNSNQIGVVSENTRPDVFTTPLVPLDSRQMAEDMQLNRGIGDKEGFYVAPVTESKSQVGLGIRFDSGGENTGLGARAETQRKESLPPLKPDDVMAPIMKGDSLSDTELKSPSFNPSPVSSSRVGESPVSPRSVPDVGMGYTDSGGTRNRAELPGDSPTKEPSKPK